MAKTEKRKIGDFGESIACKFLVKKGFEIVERNYLRKWGEVDIIARLKDTIHFVEVKSINVDLSRNILGDDSDTWQAEENIHPYKLQRMARTVETYLLEKGFEGEWQADAMVVSIDRNMKKVKVKFIENIPL
jgi:putative endonuclease